MARRFSHTGKFDGKFSSHNKLVAKGGAQCSTGNSDVWGCLATKILPDGDLTCRDRFTPLRV